METENFNVKLRKTGGHLIILGSVLFNITCMNPSGTEEVKNASRNLKNSSSTFIYNAIPENPGASVSPEYSTAINTFSIRLLSTIYKSENVPGKNVIISPFSVSRTLAVLTEGAADKAKSELLEALGGQVALDDAKDALSELLYTDKSVIFQCADAIWVDTSKFMLEPSFKENARVKYGVENRGLDLSNIRNATKFINNWIYENSGRNLANVIDERTLESQPAFILTNAVYFKADWTSPFDITKTQPEIFHSPAGDISVPMMSSGYQHKVYKTPAFQNAKIYYGTSGKDYFYLDLYMPVDMSIERFLDDSCLAAMATGRALEFGDLKMPKFTYDNRVDLIPVLQQLTIKEIFDPNTGDLSGIVQQKNTSQDIPVYIYKAEHVAGIKTDEEGTKAYAATYLAGAACSAILDPGITFNKPFVYFIRAGKNGLVLFAGVMNNPQE
jgi:serpin B